MDKKTSVNTTRQHTDFDFHTFIHCRICTFIFIVHNRIYFISKHKVVDSLLFFYFFLFYLYLHTHIPHIYISIQ